MRRPLVLLLIVAGATLWFAWRAAFLAEPQRDLSPPELPPPVAETPGAATSPGGASDAALSRSQVELPVGVKGAEPIDPMPLDDRSPTLVDDPSFSAKYAHWSSARLEARVNEIEPLYLTEYERLCDLRFEAGMYRVVDASEMQGLDGSYDVLSAYDKQGVMTRSRVVAAHDPVPLPPPNAEPEPRMEYQIVSLPPEVYPDLYRQRAELDWLRATLALRRNAGEDPP